MDKMVTPFAVAVPVAGIYHHFEIVVSELCAAGYREGATMQGMHEIAFKKMRSFPGLADAGYKQELMWRKILGHKGFFHSLQDSEVAASRAPFVFLVIRNV